MQLIDKNHHRRYALLESLLEYQTTMMRRDLNLATSC
jgi:hypothetical protein